MNPFRTIQANPANTGNFPNAVDSGDHTAGKKISDGFQKKIRQTEQFTYIIAGYLHIMNN
jgi:hypothetical protein